MYRIGIDLGGTNTAAGLVDAQGRIVDRASVKTNLPTDPQRIVNDMVHLTNLLLDRNGLQKKDIAMVGVGVATGVASSPLRLTVTITITARMMASTRTMPKIICQRAFMDALLFAAVPFTVLGVPAGVRPDC